MLLLYSKPLKLIFVIKPIFNPLRNFLNDTMTAFQLLTADLLSTYFLLSFYELGTTQILLFGFYFVKESKFRGKT